MQPNLLSALTFKLSLTGVLAFSLSSSFAWADAKTDGSVGAVASLSGNFTIPQTLGSLRGANLFHSFQYFNVNAGESANFTTTSNTIQNVITRVTGGASSNINGALSLSSATGNAPNFFFINPAGITFGAGAVVDVPAGFHISTADVVKFSDGAFFADLTKSSVLSAAAPEAFGFLGNNRATLTVKDDATFLLPASDSLSLVAGDIEIKGATIQSIAGDARVLAVGREKSDVKFDLGGNGELPKGSGQLTLLNGGSIDLYTQIGIGANIGLIQIGAGEIVIDGQGSDAKTGIFSGTDAAGSNNAGAIIFNTSGQLSLINGGKISASTQGLGSGGFIGIRAGSLFLDGKGTGITSDAMETSDGIGGDIVLQIAGNIHLKNGAAISASTLANGDAGTLNVNAGSIKIEGAESGIFSDTGNALVTENRGYAGSIKMKIKGDITISKEAKISSSSFSRRDAGTIELVTDGSISLSDQASISSNAKDSSNGYAGTVLITTPAHLSITGGSVITTSAGGSGGTPTGNNGWIDIDAGSISIDGQGVSTGISSIARPNSVGSAGLVVVSVRGDLMMQNGAEISSSTFSTGKSGIVSVAAKNILIDGMGQRSGIFSSTQNPNDVYSGYAESVGVLALEKLELINGAQIASSTTAGGNAGTINISAGSIAIVGAGKFKSDVNTGINTGINTSASAYGNAGDINIEYADRLSLAGTTSITTSAVHGDGGSINIKGAGKMLVSHSEITTSVSGADNGNGGNITLSAPLLLLDTGFIQANTFAAKATGGALTLDVGALLSSGNALFVGGAKPYLYNPNRFGFNVIQAAAPDGINGTVTISSPQIDVSGSLASLSTSTMDFNALATDLCRIGVGSSLTWLGRGGIVPPSTALLRAEK